MMLLPAVCRCAALLGLCGLATMSMLVEASPAGAVEQRESAGANGFVQLSGTPVTMIVAPGLPANWALGVTTAPISARTLVSAVTATGPSGTPTEALMIALSSCTAPWQHVECPGTEHRILQPTRMSNLTGSASPVTAAPTIPARLYLLAQVTQPTATAGPQSVAVTIGVTATGDDPVRPRGDPIRASTDELASTGVRLTLCALVGALSVTVGTLLAYLARRRQRGLRI